MTPAPAAFSPATAASSAPCSTSASTSLAPSRCKALASARPMPLAPPVITAVLPAKSWMPSSAIASALLAGPGGELRRAALDERGRALGGVGVLQRHVHQGLGVPGGVDQ